MDFINVKSFFLNYLYRQSIQIDILCFILVTLKWFEHEKRNCKPWRFSVQIDSLDDKEMIATDKKVYEMCSMAKHGNPVGKDVGFNLGVSEKGLFYGGDNDSRITDYLHWTSYYGVDAIEAGLKIVEACGLNFSMIQKELNDLKNRMKPFISENLERKIMDYVYQENPKIKEYDEKLKKLTIEKEEIERKIRHLSQSE